MSLVVRAVLIVVAALVGSVGLSSAPGSAAAASGSTAIHRYDGPHRMAIAIGTTPERGPPATHNRVTTYDAVDHWSRGVSARLDAAPILATTTYVGPTPPAKAVSATTTTSRHVVADGDLLSLSPSDVAAKTETTLARTCLRSFAGTTLVLMADGSKKPIEDIKVGDRVVATDPETGERVTRKVTHVWVHDDTLTDLELADGTVLATTEDHLFWSVTDQTFERADHLSPGEVVLGDQGREVTVTGSAAGTDRTALAYNLSIAGVHTYHVGEHSILVHNDCGDFVDLTTPKRRNHILNGDKTGGGHRAEFPAGWSDDRIMHEISDIATAPGVPWRAGKFARQRIYMRGGIEVLTDSNGNIISAWVP